MRAVGPGAPGPGRQGWRAAALVLFACGLLSKASPISLPLAWIVLGVYPLRRLGVGPAGWLGPAARRVWLEKLPFAAVAALVALLAALGKARTSAMLPPADAPWFALAGQAVYAVMFCVRATLVPVAISPLYERPAELKSLAPAFLASGALAVAVAAAFRAARRRWPAALAAWVGYLVLVASQLGPPELRLPARRRPLIDRESRRFVHATSTDPGGYE